jgi:hypothetical protein
VDWVFLPPSIILLSRPARRQPWPINATIYFKDPNGLSLEYCCTVRNLTEDDAAMQERFTVRRAALELDNTLSAKVPAAYSSGSASKA